MHSFSKVREEGEGKFPSKADKCDKIHVKCDKMIQNTTNCIFFQKCYRRVKANSLQNVMKYDTIHIFSEVRHEGEDKFHLKCDRIH